MPRIAPVVTMDSVIRSQIQRLLRASSTPQSLALRCRIVLEAADGSSNKEIASNIGIPEVTVGKWRSAFVRDGLKGLEDAPRSGRPVKHDRQVWERVQMRACQQPESRGRWSVRTLAQDLGLPRSSVHEILVASSLQPHRIRTFTFSPDPDFEAKLLDIVGLYLKPPENALVLCVDEKPGIQALDRTQPLLPLSAKRPRSWTNEYVRHGTQTLLAALEVATGRVVANVKQRRTSADFLRFMNEVVVEFPDHDLHVVWDNLNIHKNDAAQRWLARHPRVTFHHTPTHASWVNLVECFFSILSRQGLSQSVHRSRRQLKEFLLRFIEHYNENCSPFRWTKGPDKLQRIIEATKEYQADHPPKRKQRKAGNTKKN
jgi:transposase